MKQTIFFLFLCLFLTACSTLDSAIPQGQPHNFRKGSEGLSLSIEGPGTIEVFEQSDPPAELFDFIVENKGAYTLKQKELYFKIYLVDSFLIKEPVEAKTLLLSINDFNLEGRRDSFEGKTEHSSKGESLTHSLSLRPNPPPNSGITSQIQADLCYVYETQFSDTVCVTTKQQKERCEKSTYTYSNQGAPIAVTNVEIKSVIRGIDTARTVEPSVIFTLKNLKGGLFTMPDKFTDACLAKKEINKLYFEAKLGNRELVCNNNEQISFTDEMRVICYAEGFEADDSKGFFDTTLTALLKYGYMESTEMKVNIARTGITS